MKVRLNASVELTVIMHLIMMLLMEDPRSYIIWMLNKET